MQIQTLKGVGPQKDDAGAVETEEPEVEGSLLMDTSRQAKKEKKRAHRQDGKKDVGNIGGMSTQA